MNKDREKKIYYNLKENLLSVMSGLIIILLFKFILGDASNNLTEMVVIFGVAVVFFLPLEIAFIKSLQLLLVQTACI